MAPAGVRKVQRLTQGRGLARKCLLLLIVLFLIKIVLLLIQYVHLDTAHPATMGAAVPAVPAAQYADGGTWRPVPEMIHRVLKDLNLSQEEARERLPLTLESKLWLNNASRCSDASGQLIPLDVLFLVHTTPENFHRRLLMRSTTGSESYFRPFKVRLVFLLGRVANSSLQQALEMEHTLYGDLVQGDFQDSDTTLSHKGVLGFRWAWRHCSQARHVVKLDELIFFDLFKMLLRYRPIFEGRSRSMFCHVLPRGSMRIYRQRGSFWAVKENQFQGLSAFPYDYCSGLVVILTSDLIPALFRAAFFTPVFWIEDVYLFGMLPAVVGDVAMVHLGHRNAFIDLNTTSALSCMRRRQEKCSVLATTCGTTGEWEVLWNVTYNVYQESGWRVPYLVLPPNS